MQTTNRFATIRSKKLLSGIADGPPLQPKGVTLTAVGFYGPQGRVLRLPLAMPGINDRITAFRYEGYKVTNYEMESAAITGLCNLLGHRAATICLIIANRINGDASADYHSYMNKLIRYTLEKLS